jgi:S-formylglutathione hydrolase FrmB
VLAPLDVSLLGGWLPLAGQVVAAVALAMAVAMGWRDRNWLLRRLPIIAGVGAMVGVLAAGVAGPWLGITDPMPVAIWVWLGVAAGAILVVVLGWRTVRWWGRGAAILAAVLAGLVCANGVNQFVGYYPTVGAAIADWQGKPPPGQLSLSQIRGQRLANPIATQVGALVAVDIPSTATRFIPRREFVYLPPIWFHGARPPVLPVVEMIAAEHAAPENWVRIGNAVRTSDALALRQDGRAPILVFVDATESFNNDTECVNGPHGNAEDYLVKDIPRFVTTTFNASRDPDRWAVLGFSMGGTCAIGLVVEHPRTFGHFVDISGDLTPNTGDKAQTIAGLYGGSVAAWNAHDPLTVMARHGQYSGISARFVDGSKEKLHTRQAYQLSTAGRKVGIMSRVIVLPGGHTWQFASNAFAYVLPWLSAELNLPDQQYRPAHAPGKSTIAARERPPGKTATRPIVKTTVKVGPV